MAEIDRNGLPGCCAPGRQAGSGSAVEKLGGWGFVKRANAVIDGNLGHKPEGGNDTKRFYQGQHDQLAVSAIGTFPRTIEMAATSLVRHLAVEPRGGGIVTVLAVGRAVHRGVAQQSGQTALQRCQHQQTDEQDDQGMFGARQHVFDYTHDGWLHKRIAVTLSRTADPGSMILATLSTGRGLPR